MQGFEQIWGSVAGMRDGEAVLPDLKPLLLRVHDDVTSSPVNLPALNELPTHDSLVGVVRGIDRTKSSIDIARFYSRFCDELPGVCRMLRTGDLARATIL
jgi:hypothetical protein